MIARSSLVLLVACGNPFVNDLPELVAVNGVEDPGHLHGFHLDVPAGAASVDLELEVRDAESRHVRIWFPLAPEGLSFDPDGTHGVWTQDTEGDRETEALLVILEDASRDPGISEWPVAVRRD